jgi:prepilin-type N-terminal cleavage/methylation domain-containing protein
MKTDCHGKAGSTPRRPRATDAIAGQGGFTLTELMVSVAILAVLSGVLAIDFLAGLPESRLKWAARQLVSDLQAARMTAASENRDCRVRVTPETGEYRLEVRGIDPGSGTESWLPHDGVRALCDPGNPHYQKDVRIDRVTRTIICRPDGSVVAATVFLANARGDTLSVKISDAGRILVE